MVCGLYASFIGPFLYVLMGRYYALNADVYSDSAKDVTLGPTAIMSLLVSSVAGNGHGVTSLADAVTLAFFSGFIQILLGALRLG